MIPFHDDPDVLEQIYTHVPYLNRAPVTLRGFAEHTLVGSFTVGRWLKFFLAEPDTRMPYRPDHRGLTAEENAALTHQQDVIPVIVWPQPVLALVPAGDGTAVTGDHLQTDVYLRRAGSIQLWWGGGVGVIFEAYIEQFSSELATPAALNAVWDASEQHLSHKSVMTVWTDARDPMFEDAYYEAFLTARGYRDAGRGITWRKTL